MGRERREQLWLFVFVVALFIFSTPYTLHGDRRRGALTAATFTVRDCVPKLMPQSSSKRRNDNPLSAARGKRRAESLWHRKSGAGYKLFVEFYAKNMHAVCLPPTGSSNHTVSCDQGGDPVTSPPLTPKQGQSRAAKRRRKKKGKNIPTGQDEEPSLSQKEDTSTENDCEAHSSALEPTTTNTSSDPSTMHPKFSTALSNSYNQLAANQPSFRSFIEALSSPLPLTFRLRSCLDPSHRERVQRQVVDSYGTFVEQCPFKESIFQAKCSSLSKESLGKKAPALKEFLLRESGRGTLARQDLGSMLPVLTLSQGGWIEAGSKVLDMCASPGSKTLQALEIVGHAGRIKANDINEARLTALKDAVDRSNVKHADRIKYTAFDATSYPIPKNRLFDAIICDVPCSGDGTIRKDPHILPGWTPNTSNALHSLQVRILERAIHCVRPGGVVCYSTCSLNPVEDEAVVCAVLKKYDFVELQDGPMMKGFCGRRGVNCWFVADYDDNADSANDNDEPCLRWHDGFNDAIQGNMASACETMWPPKDLPNGLEKCTRLHPQDHDSGGFFVAVLKRTKQLGERAGRSTRVVLLN